MLHLVVSSGFFSLKQFLHLFLTLMTLTLEDYRPGIFVECPSLWAYLMFPHRLRFCIRRKLDGDLFWCSLGPLVKVVSARLSPCEASFPLVISEYLMGSVSQTADITLFLTKLSFTSPSVALMFFKGSAGNSYAQPGLCPVGLGREDSPM